MSDYSTVAPPQSNINQSQAFAAALQRAKQIAAKIQPTGQQQQSQPQQLQGGGGYKRSLNDEDSAGPDAKKFSSPDSYNSQQGGNMSQALAQAAAVAARLAATAGNTTEEQLRIPEALVSHLVIGRNSSDNISHIQAESGCKIQLSQESERTVTVRGSRETVTKGREMIQQMATQHGAGTVEIVLSITMPPPGPTGYPPYQEIMVPGAKVGLVIGKGGETIKMLQEKTGAKMVIIQDGPNQEVIKPLRISGDFQKIEHAKMLVFELIQDKDTVRPGGGGFNNSNGSGGESAEVFVPKVAVGVVIGKGGDMIKKIQGETGCKLQFIQGKNDEPGDRRCIIQGSRQQVEDAKRMIEGLIESVMRSQQNNNRNNNAGGGGGGGGGQQADNTNSNYGYGYGVNHTQQAAREEVTFSVPASKCGIVIGRGGETIKLINQQTGAYCEMDRSAVNPPSEKMFKAKGTPEQIEHARQMISEKINIDLVVLSRKPIGNAPNHQNNYNNNGGMQSDPNAAAYQQQWAGYAQQGGWDQSQQQQQQQMGAMPQASAAGQADYSSQWIEYYKSMGMHREAEMIEQQLKAKQVMAGAANPAMPAATPQMTPQPQVQPQQQQQVQQQQQQQQQQHAQQQQQQQQQAGQAQAPDYSAQWAEYYRSIGKMEEAEAIEKQMKSGASNGQATASASVSAPTQPAAAAAAPQQPAAGGYPQGMTPSQYAQYSQYYAAAAAAGQPGGYPQQAYPGYGYPAGPQPGMPGGPQAAGAGGPPNPQQQQQQQPQQHKPSSKPNDKK